MRFPATILCLLLLTSSCAFAGPVHPADIDANAVWYGHLDMEAIMQIPLVHELHASALHSPKMSTMKRFWHKLGVQMMGEFLSATMYATQYKGDFGVVLMKFRIDLPKEPLCAVFAQKFPEYETTMIGNRKVSTWKIRCGRKHVTLSGCFVNDRHILIGIDRYHLEHALQVLDGRRPAISPSHRLFKGLTPGILFVSRAIDVPADYQQSTYCPVLKHSNEAFARWTCLGDTIRGRYEFQTRDEETASLYQTAIEGMKALFTLRFGDLDEVMPLLEGFSNDRVAKTVFLSWEGSAGEVKAACEQIRSRRRQVRAMRKEQNRQYAVS